MNTPNTQLQNYEIRLKGHLEARWSAWFDGLAITLEADGNTLLSGPVADQAALFGLLKKVRDTGMLLISVNCVSASGVAPAAPHPKRSYSKSNRRKS